MFVILNREKETDSVVIFLHIVKTGGSTLHRIFDRVYREDYDVAVNCKRFKWSNDLPLEQKKRIEVLRGHFSFGIHKQLPQKKFTYITLIRNPIERIVSDYYYILRTKDHIKHNAVINMTLYEFATKKEYNKLTSNLQTRQISGNNEVDLERAKNNLEKYFSVVGITERFDDTLYCIRNKLGWKNIIRYKNENTTPNRPSVKEIPKKAYEVIKKNNNKDLELYKFANELLDKQLQQLKN